MQVNRLFQIVYLLLHKKKVTAKELSNEFEVSVRTIYRDVETLSSAGIPIFMSQGKGGGIELLEDFVLDKTVLSESEQTEILSALKGLSVVQEPDADQLLSKMSHLFHKPQTNWIEIDFSDWSGNDEKYQLIKTAILEKHTIAFSYFNSYGQKSSRIAAPLQLWFKGKTWYIKAFCFQKSEPRVFKISRMKEVTLSDLPYPTDIVFSQNEPIIVESREVVSLTLYIQANLAYRVYDDFEENQITILPNGDFEIHVSYPHGEWVLGYLLSFGSGLKVLEPLWMQDLIKQTMQNALTQYL
ncbi:YafY family protein [Paludicola sp. MB14-C6]|uniref:helix-turn-helix transcriptional regulator n=1 Tax=Paludihabitans sp. MB14-C6 TaxID=3070656 RepID=UPI0027DCAA24|nr:YafY family protein [Paludicola sp. MB14-C6]WMJ21938.1 YafY family protein [Paludicola sp. MB14-C6]